MPWTDEGRKRGVEVRVQVRREQQQDHDERVRPYFQATARLGLRGNALLDYLEANDVPPPQGTKWTRMAAQRIRRRLGLEVAG